LRLEYFWNYIDLSMGLHPRLCWGPYNTPQTRSWWGGVNIKIVATRCHILRLKCTKFDFGCGSAPDSAGGAYSTPPNPLAGGKGLTAPSAEPQPSGASALRASIFDVFGASILAPWALIGRPPQLNTNQRPWPRAPRSVRLALTVVEPYQHLEWSLEVQNLEIGL